VKNRSTVEQPGRDGIERILARADEFGGDAAREVQKVPALRGRLVVNLFYEASTRTTSSFELAAKRLSADVISVRSSGSSVEKGESLKDTVTTLGAYDPAVIVVRHPRAGAANLVAGWTPAAVVNAGDGAHAHPTQALLDAQALRTHMGPLDGKSIWIVGDIAHSRVARSTAAAFRLLGMDVTLCGPPTLLPPRIGEALDCRVTTDISGIGEADAVYALRMQRERMQGGDMPSLREYALNYRIGLERMRPGQVLMHPGPVNRGVEVTGEAVDSPASLVARQVSAGVAVRMAVLYEVSSGATSRQGSGEAEAA